jgi:uncharacterized protein (DUF1778 family)
VLRLTRYASAALWSGEVNRARRVISAARSSLRIVSALDDPNSVAPKISTASRGWS